MNNNLNNLLKRKIVERKEKTENTYYYITEKGEEEYKQELISRTNREHRQIRKFEEVDHF
ncbi:MAG: hypothetical protein BTN85_1210 [Candidatus Methanohalarchaeum thermophilum]|uniref:Uncharacterized protein n=1 Tax=Methanohalarchaeum thermophilum TaxID=1903181 RepID=A0A1Q6DWG9_METT1|nr:MAG: hypothetical protein BTN85_1210 [Candidatus Methanohalarchaeum thermophilum]